MADPITDIFNVGIENQEEVNIDRDSYILNQKAGALVFDNTAPYERAQFSHRSGANLKLDNRVFSLFSPNTYQSDVNGKSFITVKNDSFETSEKNMEKRSYGDFTVITGARKFFNDSIAQEYIDTFREVATLKATPEFKIPAVTNNSSIEHPVDGKPAEGGCVEGGSWKKNTSTEKTQDVIKDKAKRLTEIEAQMGKGGSIKLMAAKHLFFQAGTAAVNYDSSNILPNAQPVTAGYDWDEANIKEVRKAVPVYQSADTSSAMPFGDVTFKAMGKLNMEAGSGGLSFTTSGESKIATTGRLALGGAEVAIGGSTIGGAGTVKVSSDALIESISPIIKSRGSNFIVYAGDKCTITSPETTIVGDLRVQGNLIVSGNITCYGESFTMVNGNVYVEKGNADVAKNITAGIQVKAPAIIGTTSVIGATVTGGIVSVGTSASLPAVGSGLSLRNHVHPQPDSMRDGGGDAPHTHGQQNTLAAISG